MRAVVAGLRRVERCQSDGGEEHAPGGVVALFVLVDEGTEGRDERDNHRALQIAIRMIPSTIKLKPAMKPAHGRRASGAVTTRTRQAAARAAPATTRSQTARTS